jgi:hypothetical protein
MEFAKPPPGFKPNLSECAICNYIERSPKTVLTEDFCICDCCMNKGETDDETRFRIDELLLWAL